jgi:PhnB protein
MTIAPWLSVADATAAVAFYKTAFDAVELYLLEEGGIVGVAQLSIGGADLWLSDDPDSAPAGRAGGAVRMIVTVDDPDSLFDQVVAAGAEVVADMHEDYGWRIGRVVDPFGHHWEIGKQI